jgi:hypothetical protein
VQPGELDATPGPTASGPGRRAGGQAAGQSPARPASGSSSSRTLLAVAAVGLGVLALVLLVAAVRARRPRHIGRRRAP